MCLPQLPTVLCCWWQKWQTAGQLFSEKHTASFCGRHRLGTSPVPHGTTGRHHPAITEVQKQKTKTIKLILKMAALYSHYIIIFSFCVFNVCVLLCLITL